MKAAILEDHLTHCNLETPKRYLVNSGDPDQTPQNAASDQGFLCLQNKFNHFSLGISK